MICNVQLTSWLQSATIDIIEIVKILQHNKPLRSMDVFNKLKRKGIVSNTNFAQFSKLLCSVLLKHGLVEIIQLKGVYLYTIAIKKNGRRRK